MRAARAAAALLCALAAVAVAVATWGHLGLGFLAQGVAQGYRLHQLALLAAAAATVWLCGFGLVTRRFPQLLAGPVVLSLIGLELVLQPPQLDPEESTYLALVVEPGITSLPTDLLVVASALAIGLGLPTWALLRSRPGTPPQDPALPP